MLPPQDYLIPVVFADEFLSEGTGDSRRERAPIRAYAPWKLRIKRSPLAAIRCKLGLRS